MRVGTLQTGFQSCLFRQDSGKKRKEKKETGRKSPKVYLGAKPQWPAPSSSCLRRSWKRPRPWSFRDPRAVTGSSWKLPAAFALPQSLTEQVLGTRPHISEAQFRTLGIEWSRRRCHGRLRTADQYRLLQMGGGIKTREQSRPRKTAMLFGVLRNKTVLLSCRKTKHEYSLLSCSL